MGLARAAAVFVSLCLVLTALLFPASPPASANPPFRPPVEVTDAPSPFRAHTAVAVAPNGTIYAAWDDLRTGNADVYLASSADGGATFGPNRRVNDDTGTANQGMGDLEVDTTGAVHLVWSDGRGALSAVYATLSTDGGTAFEPNVIVDTGGQPRLAIESSGKLHVVFRWSGILYANSTDGGRTWSPTQTIATLGTSLVPDVAVGAPGEVYVTFESNAAGTWDSYVMRSTDGGSTWSAPQIVHPSAPAGDQRMPRIDYREGRLAVVWDLNSAQIEYAVSRDGGASFEAPVRVHPAVSYNNINPVVVLGVGNETHVTWVTAGIGPSNDVYYAFSPDGVTFSPPVRVPYTTEGGQSDPDLALLPSGDVGVVYAHVSPDRTSAVYFSATPTTPPSVSDLWAEGHAEGSAAIRHLGTRAPRFNWTFVPGSPPAPQKGFEIRVRDAPGDTGLLLWSCSAASAQPEAVFNATCGGATPLMAGTDYWVRVRAQDTWDAWTAWREVGFHVNAVPTVSPVDPPPGSSRAPDPAEQVAWTTAPDPEGDALSFEWFVDDGPIGAPYVATGNTTGASSAPFATLPNVTYAWCVNVSDGWGFDDASCAQPWTFSVVPNGTPRADAVSVDGVLGGTPEALHRPASPTTFAWSYADPEGDPQAGSEVRVGTSAGAGDVWAPSAVPGTTTSIAYAGPVLGPGTTYSLSVRVADAHGWGSWRTTTFRVNAPPPPPTDPVPSPGSRIPADAAQTLSWTGAGDPDGDPVAYAWEVSTRADFATVLANGTTSGDVSEAFPTVPGGVYYWRVRAFDGWAWSSYGGVWTFEIATTTPATNPGEPPWLLIVLLVILVILLLVVALFVKRRRAAKRAPPSENRNQDVGGDRARGR